MKKILYTSDTHVDPAHLDRLLAAAGDLGVDTVIIGGDLIPMWEWTLAASIEPQRQWIRDIFLPRIEGFCRSSPGISLFLDFGNDDLIANRALLEEREGKPFVLLHHRAVVLNTDLAMVGYMTVPPTPFKLKDWEKADCHDRTGLEGDVRKRGARTNTGLERPYELKLSKGTMEQDLVKLTELLEEPSWSGYPFLFVSHAPPLNTALDCLYDGRHVGSLAVRRFIEHWGPSGRLRACFHGHIHESPWVSGRVHDEIAGVQCFNVGQKLGQLRALMFESENIENSARLVVVKDLGQEYTISIRTLAEV